MDKRYKYFIDIENPIKYDLISQAQSRFPSCDIKD